MNIAARFSDPDAFLAWCEGKEGRRELVRGQVVMQAMVTRGHERVVRALTRALERLLDPARYEVSNGALGVKTPDSVRCPDVLIDRAGGGARDLAAIAPLFIAEVLSPSSLEIDFVEKPAEYQALPTLGVYLVLAQDEPRGWLWHREGEGWSRPVPSEGFDEEIRLDIFGIAVAMREVYAHLVGA